MSEKSSTPQQEKRDGLSIQKSWRDIPTGSIVAVPGITDGTSSQKGMHFYVFWDHTGEKRGAELPNYQPGDRPNFSARSLMSNGFRDDRVVTIVEVISDAEIDKKVKADEQLVQKGIYTDDEFMKLKAGREEWRESLKDLLSGSAA
jgi:hypothetical protein